MRWTIRVPILLTILACNRDKDPSGSDTVEQTDPSLVLLLSSEESTAGAEIAYTLVATHADGTEEAVPGTLSDDAEPGLSWDADSLTPTLAGDHLISATAEVDGEELVATDTLVVAAGAPVSLDLSLSASTMPAGESLAYTVTGTDAYGNSIDSASAIVVASSEDISVGDGLLSGTLVGSYSATAGLEGQEDTEYFQIVPAAAMSVTLSLSDLELEVDDESTATVVVLDEYNNPTEDPWTLSVSGGDASVDGSDILFEGEGVFTVRVDVDGTGLYDEVGPLVVDSSGPELEITNPERGGWSESDTDTMTGTVSDEVTGIDSLTVNGAEVEVGVDGSFSTELDYVFGLNILETTAVDADGNEVNDTRAVLAGEFLPYGSAVSGGMLARIHDGDGGLDELEALGDGLVTATMLDSLIPYPAYSYAEETCIDYWWDEYCFDWYSVTLYLTSPSLSSTSLVLDPMSTGQLSTTFTVVAPSINWSGSGDVVGIGYSGSGTVSADSIAVVMYLTPTVSGGAIGATVDSVDVISTGFDFDVDSWLYDALEYVGIDFDSMVQGYLEDAIEDQVYSQVPALIEDTLQDLEIGYNLDIGDGSYTFAAEPDGIVVDDTGITLSLGTTFTADSWTLSRSGLGSLSYGYAQPAWTGSPGTVIGVNEDFLNQVFFALWGGGVLSLQMTDEDLGLDPADLALVLPGLTDLTLSADPLLPPVVVPGTGSDLLDLQVGDMLLTLYNGPAESGYEYLQVYVSAIAGLDVAVSEDNTLLPTVGDTTLYFDVVYPDANSTEAAAVEELLALLVPMILPEFTGSLTSIEIPDIEGFGLTGIAVGLEGAESGYVTLGGDLAAE